MKIETMKHKNETQQNLLSFWPPCCLLGIKILSAVSTSLLEACYMRYEEWMNYSFLKKEILFLWRFELLF